MRGGVMVQDQDQFYDVAHRNRHTAFLAGKLDVGDHTTITAGGGHDRFGPAVQSGTPGIVGGRDGSDGQLPDVARSTYPGADWNRFRSEIRTAFADVTHRIGDRWTLRASGLFTAVDRLDVYSYIGNQPIPPANGATGRSGTDVEQYGMYRQIRPGPLAGLALVDNGRLTWWDVENRTLYPVPAVARTGYAVEGRFTPYAGIVWDVTDDPNLYASYADSFTPQSATLPRVDGGAIQPPTGEQYEAGSKLTLFGGRLPLSAAAYQIIRTNRLFSDPALPAVARQIGKVRARGGEAEAQGEILPGWRVNGGYTYNRNEYLEDTTAVFEGISFVPVIPRHSVKAFTNYAPAAGPLAGFGIGGSLAWFSSTFGGTPALYNADGTLRTRSSIVPQGGYAVADLRAGCRFSERLSPSVNVNNLSDKAYHARTSATGRDNHSDSPRAVCATLRLTYP